MKKLVGVYKTNKKDGTIYYRSSITYKGRHISLGSFENTEHAHIAYLQAKAVLYDQNHYQIEHLDTYFDPSNHLSKKAKKHFAIIDMLTYDKVVILLNFRDNGILIHSPIYVRKNYFVYYLSANHHLTFDRDDLFYYSSHKIMKRGNHLFVADYGMQVTILSRYGIRSHAVRNRDFRFINGDETDYRYGNIENINPYFGVYREGTFGNYTYRVKIHINGNYTVGVFKDEETAAIAYNKAADFCHSYGISKAFPVNYIETISPKKYAEIYSSITIADRFKSYVTSGYNQ